MQFLGMIDKKALSWVVRAADFDNYYVVKLVVLKPGPLPTIGVTRYAVVNGKAGHARGHDRAHRRARRHAVPGADGCSTATILPYRCRAKWSIAGPSRG